MKFKHIVLKPELGALHAVYIGSFAEEFKANGEGGQLYLSQRSWWQGWKYSRCLPRKDPTRPTHIFSFQTANERAKIYSIQHLCPGILLYWGLSSVLALVSILFSRTCLLSRKRLHPETDGRLQVPGDPTMSITSKLGSLVVQFTSFLK